MNKFAKSILNYYATFTETRFRFKSRIAYKWTNDHMTSDFPVFPKFQIQLLDSIKNGKKLDITIKKGDYSIGLDLGDFKKRLSIEITDQYNADYFEKCISESKNNLLETLCVEKKTDEEKERMYQEDPDLQKRIFHEGGRKYNLAFRSAAQKTLLKLQEEKKDELSNFIKGTYIPHTTFNPHAVEQEIYDSIQTVIAQASDTADFIKKIHNIIQEGSWDLEMYDLYSLIRKFGSMLGQTMGTAYIFFHEIFDPTEEEVNKYPLFMLEIEISDAPGQVRIKNDKNIMVVNTPAINSFGFGSILTIPRAARLIEAKDYLYGVEKFFQNIYDMFTTFILEQNFAPLVKPQKPNIHFRVGMQIVLKEDRKLLDYSELITRIDAGKGGKFIDFINNYVSGNVVNTTDEVEEEYKEKYPSRSASTFLSTIPLSLNKTQKRILTALGNAKNKIIVIDGPPGTGKSYTIAAMAYWANKNKKSVVVTSHKKSALDVIDRMMTDQFCRIHPKAKPSIMRISKEDTETVNNFQNTLSGPVIAAATRRVSEFRKDAVSKDEETLRSSLKIQIEEFMEKSDTYKEMIQKLFEYEKLEKDLKEKGKISGENKPTKQGVENLQLDILFKDARNVPDDILELSLDQLSFAMDNANKFSSLLGTCNLLNTLGVEIDVLRGIENIPLEVNEEYANKMKKICKHIDHKSKIFVQDIKVGLFTKVFKKNEINKIASEISELDDLKYSNVLDSVEKLCSKKKDELTVKDILHAISVLSKITRKREDIDFFFMLCEKLELMGKDIREIYEFLNTIKNFTKNIDGQFSYQINVFKGVYGVFLKDANLDLERLKDLNGLVKNDSHEDLRVYIRLFHDICALERTDKIQFSLIANYNEVMQKQIEQLNDERIKNLNNYVGDLSRIDTSIKTNKRLTSNEAKVLLENISCILAEPDLISRYFPMDEGMIDILIIDEASQVSIAESISLILRSKQVVVLGDELQYGAVGAVNVNKIYSAQYFNEILDGYQNDYKQTIDIAERNKIIEDVSREIGNDEQESEIVFKPEEGTREWIKTFNIRTSTLSFARALRNYSISLDTHFRSFSEIIDYSNEFFYKPSQIPLTVNRVRTKPITDVLRFIKVDTQGNPGNCQNLDEIEAIKNDIQSMINNGYKGTIGIITSFREQKDQVEKILKKEMPNYHKLQMDHKLAIWFVGDVQGEERDIIYYSFVEDKKIGNGSLRTIYPVSTNPRDIRKLKMQRLNVGFSRAKDTMIFVHSMSIEDYSDTYLGEALKHYKLLLESAHDNYIEDESVFGSPAEKELYKMIMNTSFYRENRDKIRIIAQFPIGQYIKETFNKYIPKYRVDFLMTVSSDGKEKSLILEYDGIEFHTNDPSIVDANNFSQEYLEYDIERQVELESYGYRFLRINKFTLIPKEKDQTKIDVLNALLNKEFSSL